MAKLYHKSRLSKKSTSATIMNNQPYDNEETYAKETLTKARVAWDGLYQFREDRDRNVRYTYGNQWGDMIIGEDGKSVTEEAHIIAQGNSPITNNLIQRLVSTLKGVYRNQNKEPMCVANDRDEQKLGETMSVTLQCNRRLNKMSEVNARLFEEFLISGFVATKESFYWRDDKEDCWTDTPHANHMFFDGGMRDFRYWDISLIGEIHDCEFNEVCSSFARNPADYEVLKKHYRQNEKGVSYHTTEKLTGDNQSSADFLMPTDPKMCRVIEVWTKELKPRWKCHDLLQGAYYKEEIESENLIIAENSSRLEQGLASGMREEDIPLIEYSWFMDEYWYFRYLTPTGNILLEGESPFKHKSHPYTIKIYPFVDGKAHSFVSNVIDQQKYINRLIMVNDFMLRAGAKGVLMFPEELIPDGYNMDDIASEWRKANGFILYKSKPGVQMPKQISSSSVNVGVSEMLKLQLSLIEDISGVNGAMQGKPGFSGMSASLYAQQQQNSSVSIADILETFSSFERDGSIKKVKNIQQFYTDRRVINIAGSNSVVEYDPTKISNVEYDLSIVDSQTTPTMRAIGNDLLMQLFSKGAITVEQLLECGSFSFADTLLQSIKSQKETMQEQGEVQPDQNMEMLNKYMQQ